MKFEWSAQKVKNTGYVEVVGTLNGKEAKTYLSAFRVRNMSQREFERLIKRLQEALEVMNEA